VILFLINFYYVKETTNVASAHSIAANGNNKSQMMVGNEYPIIICLSTPNKETKKKILSYF